MLCSTLYFCNEEKMELKRRKKKGEKKGDIRNN
jgi:hypothetical protein